MKYLFLFLALCTISVSSIAQVNTERRDTEPDYYQEAGSENIQMAGKHLKKYTQQFYIGTGLMVAGYTVTSLSLASAVANSGSGTVSGGAGITIGSLMLLGGAVVQILSHRHIGKAGRLLEQSNLGQGLQLQGSTDGLGIGLAYRF